MTSVFAIDQERLRGLGRERLPPAAEVPLPTPEPRPPASAYLDISDALEAVEFTASSLSAMSARIVELEVHAQALAAANHELERHGEGLDVELSAVSRQRDSLAAELKTENERSNRLEILVAQHVSRATSLECDLGAMRANLEKIAEAVSNTLGMPS